MQSSNNRLKQPLKPGGTIIVLPSFVSLRNSMTPPDAHHFQISLGQIQVFFWL